MMRMLSGEISTLVLRNPVEDPCIPQLWAAFVFLGRPTELGWVLSGPWASVTGTVFVAMPLLQRVLETGALPRAPSIRPAA